MTKTELKNIIKEALREDYFFFKDYENSDEPVEDTVQEEPSRVSCNWVPVRNWDDMSAFAFGTDWSFARENGKRYYDQLAKYGKFFKCGSGDDRRLKYVDPRGQVMVRDIHDRAVRESYRMHEAKKLTEKR